VKIGEAKDRTYNDTGLSPGTYYYFVQAVNENGRTGPNSSGVSVEVKEVFPPPPDQNSNAVSQTILVAIIVVIVAVIAIAFLLMGRRNRQRKKEHHDELEIPPLPKE
jgi:hypothetical protein